MKRTNKTLTGHSFRFDPLEIPELFLRPQLARSANAMVVADSVFEIERAFRYGCRVRKATLPLYAATAFRYHLKALQKLLHDLIVFVLAEDLSFTLKNTKLVSPTPKKPRHFEPTRNVCLFSGGVDSYSGILLAQEKFKNVVGVFAAHSDQARMIHIVRGIERKVLAKARIELHELRVPSVGARGYAQLRGFLYIVGAGAWMDLLKADRLLVTECGPTMYQPKFSPFDSITMTTHPRVIRFAGDVLRILLQREIEIVTPFEDLTKAEVIAISPDQWGLRYTHSCISQRFGRHDGTCYGCVIRRLAAIAAGVEDVRYDKNPIVDKHAKAGNLMSLLAYSYDLLVDYRQMDTFEIEMIEAYSKQDLFRRFALDNFAAIHRLIQNKQRVRAPILRMYESLVARLGTKILAARLDDLQKPKVVPAL
jgi:7-cyano-7-deazaguanine synthase in queuosine biosynthesis